MRIIGGTFGTTGSAYIGEKGAALLIEGAMRARCTPKQIEALDTRTEKERSFSVLSCLLGLVFLVPLGWFLFGIIGLMTALVLTFAGSRSSITHHVADIKFAGGSRVELRCTAWGINKLIRFWRRD